MTKLGEKLISAAKDNLVDRDCVRLDGDCMCNDILKDCKYLKKDTFALDPHADK